MITNGARITGTPTAAPLLRFWKGRWPSASIATSTRWRAAVRPIAGMAATAAACSPSSAISSSAVPRTRRFNPLAVVRAYARRARHIDRMILACLVLGLSTRKLATGAAATSATNGSRTHPRREDDRIG